MASNRQKLLGEIVHNDWKQVQHCGVDSDRRCGPKLNPKGVLWILSCGLSLLEARQRYFND